MGSYNKMADDVWEVPVPEGAVRFSARVTYGMKAEYEDWLEGRARKRLFELRPTLSDQEFKESMRSVQETSASCGFGWGSDSWLASINTIPGSVKMMWIMARAVKQEALNGVPLTEEKLLDWMQDPTVRANLTGCVREILSSAQTVPNFLFPPIRGASS